MLGRVRAGEQIFSTMSIETHSPNFGEGNGNPLQWSCLENPRDGEAWWAAISGVARSRTRLKRLSSSSNSLSVFLPGISHGQRSFAGYSPGGLKRVQPE